MFVHFGMNTFTGREWGDGTESPQRFAPKNVDPRQWARVARECGFASMILTAKHHDGFCLWPTATTRHSVASSPWRDGKGDLVREFVDACRKEGLQAGLYVSPWDRNHPTYGSGRAYDDVYVQQLHELLGNYGPLTEIWFDGANGEGADGKRQQYDWPRIIATVRRLQPQAVIFSDAGPDVRWVGNETGSAGAANWSMVDPTRVAVAGANDPWTVEALQQGDPDGSVWRPAETDVSIRPGWFWHAAQTPKVRTPENLLQLYLQSIGRNSKLLLNVPPNVDGRFDAVDIAALRGFDACRSQLLADDLLQGAQVIASSGDAPAAVLDTDPAHVWSADGHARDGWLEFTLPAPVTFDVLALHEAIQFGQHVAGYRMQFHDGRDWRTISWGSTIGHCRMARFAGVTARRLRLLIDFAYAQPRIARVSLLRYPAGVPQGRRNDDHSGA